MEATGVYWKPVWHILEASFHLVLGNAMHLRKVPGRKTDVNAGWEVLHVASEAPPEPHRLTGFAQSGADRHLSYPADGELPLET